MRRGVLLLVTTAALALPSTAAADTCIGNPGCPYTANATIPVPVPLYGLAVDGAGNLYGSNPEAAQVYRLSPSGNLTGNWASAAQGSVLLGVAVSADGSQLYAVDNRLGSVIAFNGASPGTPPTATLAAGQLSSPWGVALDAGNLVVGDGANFRVVELAPDGSIVAQARTLAAPRWPVVTPNGTFWEVGEPFAANADVAPSSLIEFDSNLNQVGSGTLPFEADAQGAAIDSIGDLFVSDAASSLILQFNADGVLVNLFGGAGSESGLFDDVLGLAIDSSDTLYAVDSGNNRLQSFKLADAAQATAIGAKATVDGGRAPIRVRCLARGIPSCEGRLTLQRHGATVGKRTFSIADDTTERVRVRLRRAGARLLEDNGKLKVKAFSRTASREGTPDRVTSAVQRLK